MYHEYMEENWPKKDFCGGPFSPKMWDEFKYGNVFDYFFRSNINSLSSEILEEIFISKYGEEGDFGYDQYREEYNFIKNMLIDFGYGEKMKEYLSEGLNDC